MTAGAAGMPPDQGLAAAVVQMHARGQGQLGGPHLPSQPAGPAPGPSPAVGGGQIAQAVAQLIAQINQVRHVGPMLSPEQQPAAQQQELLLVSQLKRLIAPAPSLGFAETGVPTSSPYQPSQGYIEDAAPTAPTGGY